MCDQSNLISTHVDKIQNETMNRSWLDGTVSKINSNYKLRVEESYIPQKSNNGKGLFACQLPVCNKGFTRKLRLNKHIKEHCGV